MKSIFVVLFSHLIPINISFPTSSNLTLPLLPSCLMLVPFLSLSPPKSRGLEHFLCNSIIQITMYVVAVSRTAALQAVLLEPKLFTAHKTDNS